MLKFSHQNHLKEIKMQTCAAAFIFGSEGDSSSERQESSLYNF